MSADWESVDAENAIVAALTRAQAAWPGLKLSDSEFVAFLVARLTPSELATARVEDLYLACGCARGDATALAAFEAYLSEVDAAHRRVRVPISLDEAKQQVRTRLLVADDAESGPRIARYRGAGDLRGWVRVAATRHLLNVATRLAPDEKGTPDALEDAAAAGSDPELAFFRERYGKDFKLAFERAVGELSARERALLRQSICDRASIDAIGEAHGIHRATAARWVAAARDALQKNVRRALRELCKMNDDDVESALRIMGSAIELSVSRLLGPGS